MASTSCRHNRASEFALMTMPSIGIGEGRRVVTGRTDMLALGYRQEACATPFAIRVQIATLTMAGAAR